MKNVKNKYITLGIVFLFCLCYFTPLIFVAPNSNKVDIQKESLPKTNALTQTLLHSYDFEGDTVGQNPSGVTLSVIEPAGSGTANVDSLGDAQQNHVAVHKDGGSQRVELRDNISYYGNTFDAGVFHCKIYHDFSLFGIMFQDDIGVLFRLDWYDGIIGRYSPHAEYTYYSHNRWYDVVVYFNLSLGWMFEIDGVRFGDGYAYPFEHGSSGGLEWIRWCSAFSGGGNGFFRVDDVEFYYYVVLPPSLTITAPDSTSSWETGTTQSITWTSTGSIPDVKIELYEGGVFEMEIIGSTTNDGTYNWDIPTDLEDGIDYQIKISDVANLTTNDFSVNFEIFTSVIDSLTVTTPDSTSSWEAGTSQTITWASTGTISNIKIELYNNDVFVMEITSDTTNDGEYYWSLPSALTNSDQYQIKISDVSNPSTYDFSDYFEITSPVSAPPGIPGYNFYILIGVISIVSVILLKNRKKF